MLTVSRHVRGIVGRELGDFVFSHTSCHTARRWTKTAQKQQTAMEKPALHFCIVLVFVKTKEDIIQTASERKTRQSETHLYFIIFWLQNKHTIWTQCFWFIKNLEFLGHKVDSKDKCFWFIVPQEHFNISWVQKCICRSIEVQRIVFHKMLINQRSPSYHADRNPLQMLFCRCFSMLRSDSHPRRNTTWSGPFHFYTTDSSDLNESLMCFSGVTKSTARASHCSIQTSSWENENERRATANCNNKC